MSKLLQLGIAWPALIRERKALYVESAGRWRQFYRRSRDNLVHIAGANGGNAGSCFCGKGMN
jgi:hypothetical protein